MVRMQDRPLWAVALIFLLVMAPVSYAGTSAQRVTGATATVTDITTLGASVQVLNTSNQDITAYTIAIETTFADGHANRSESMKDYGPDNTAKGEILHPGSTDEIRIGGWESTAKVKVKVSAVVYADKTSEASDAEALGRIVDHRTSMALMTNSTVGVLRTVLADPANEHPGKEVASRIRTVASSPKAAPGIDKEFMKAVSEEYENAPRRASDAGVTERQYLTERLAAMEQQAAAETSYAQVRRQP